MVNTIKNEIIKKLSPAEEELKKKKAELSKLSDKIADLQLEISTIESGIHAFRGLYLNRLGKKFLYFDELKSKLAQADAQNNPTDDTCAKESQHATDRMNATAEEVGEFTQPGYEAERFIPTESIKSLFRKVAKLIHPDLANDGEDRKKREQLMRKANEAYRNGDEKRLQEILDNEKLSNTDKEYKDVGEQLVITIRLISEAKNKIKEMQITIKELFNSDDWNLKSEYEENTNQGIDLFDKIERELDEQIEELKNALASL